MALMLLLEEENRRALRRARVFLPRTNPLESYSDEKLLRRFRMPRHVLLEVIDLIKDDLEPPTSRSQSIPASLQCLCALRFFATGQLQDDSADVFGFSQPTISKIVKSVAAALASKAKDVIRFPKSVARQREIKEGFFDEERCRIPNVIGLIDGSLIGIKTPSTDEESFVSRKGGHAINVQGICDHQMKFTNVVVKWPGSTHDAFMWNNCALKNEFENGDIHGGLLLGDSAYPLRPWLLRPIQTTANDAEESFNVHHRRMRQKIENCFCRWKMRWLCIHKYGK